MTDTPTTNYGLRQQELGTNTNTWGDTKLNQVLQDIDQIFGTIKPIAITGDYTITSTNYVTTADNKNAGFKFTGTLSANAYITLPTVNAKFLIVDATTGGYSLIPRTAAGASVTMGPGSIAVIGTDGTDAVNLAPNYIGARLQGVSTGTLGTDAVNKTQMETAIANAGLPASAGTVLNSSTDTTAGYLSQKIFNYVATVNSGANEQAKLGSVVSATDTTPGYLGQKVTQQLSGLTTTQVSGLVSVTLATINGGANEQLALQVGGGYVGGFLNGGNKSSQFTPVVGTEYNCDFTSSSWTVNLSGMTTPQVGQKIKLNCYGNYQPFLLGTVNSLTNLLLDAGTSGELTYSSSTWGWN